MTNAQRSKKYIQKRNIERPWVKHLLTARRRCNNPNYKYYKNYGGRGIKYLITEEEIKVLWFRDGAYLMKKPSIDRIDNDGDYTVENCRFLENKINKRCKYLILQYDLDGKFINEWKSQSEIDNFYGYRNVIGRVLRGKTKTAKGFFWKYKE